VSRRRVAANSEYSESDAQEAPAAPCRCACGQDLIPLSALAARLNTSTYTLRRWHRLHGLPLIRLTVGGPPFALWSQVEAWVRKHMASEEEGIAHGAEHRVSGC